MPNNALALNDKLLPAGRPIAPPTPSQFDNALVLLAAEHRGGALSQSHLALVLGRAVTHDLLAGADGPRREHRGGALSQSHLALVLGRAVTHDLLAHNGPPGIHDLMHRMSPVYESPPSWYPTA